MPCPCGTARCSGAVRATDADERGPGTLTAETQALGRNGASADALRFAVVGCGVAGGLLANGVAGIANGELVGICDLQPEAMHRLRAKCGVADSVPGFTDAQAMLRKVRPDVLCVATLPPTHRILVEMGLDAGLRGIFCEKPISWNARDGRAIIAACEERGIPLAVPHQFRFLPHGREIREQLQSGVIGEIDHVLLRFQNWDMINAAVHWINGFLFFTDDAPVKWVMACVDGRTHVVRDGMQVETQAVAYFENENGVRCSVECGEAVSGGVGDKPFHRIVGTRGSITWQGWANEYSLVHAGQKYERVVPMVRSDRRDAEPFVDGHSITRTGHTAVLEHLAVQIASGKSDYANPRQALASVEIVQAAYVSGHRGERVSLPLSGEEFTPDNYWPGKPVSGRSS